MGNDGGSIPDRRDLVKTKPKVTIHCIYIAIWEGRLIVLQAEQADKANQVRARWFFCALSKVCSMKLIISITCSDAHNPQFVATAARTDRVVCFGQIV